MRFIPQKRIIFFAAAACYFHPSLGMAQHAAAANVCQTSQSFTDLTQCRIDASKKADQQLNQIYGVLRKKLLSETFQRLQTAQRLWVQFRDAECQAEYPVELPGSPIIHAECIEAITRQRTEELKLAFGNQIQIEVSPETAATHLIKKVEPVYPAFAKAAGLEGVVRVKVGISPDGKVSGTFNQPGALAGAAHQAVLQYVYEPFTLEGMPVSVSTSIDVPFTLPQGAARSYPAPKLLLEYFSEIKNEDNLHLSPQMQQWLSKDLEEIVDEFKSENSSAEELRIAIKDGTSVASVRGEQGRNPVYLISRRAGVVCGATGNCPIDLVEDMKSGVKVITSRQTYGWGVLFRPRKGSPYPDVFFATNMSAGEQEISGFANISGEWGELYCGNIIADGPVTVESNVKECH